MSFVCKQHDEIVIKTPMYLLLFKSTYIIEKIVKISISWPFSKHTTSPKKYFKVIKKTWRQGTKEYFAYRNSKRHKEKEKARTISSTMHHESWWFLLDPPEVKTKRASKHWKEQHARKHAGGSFNPNQQKCPFINKRRWVSRAFVFANRFSKYIHCFPSMKNCFKSH